MKHLLLAIGAVLASGGLTVQTKTWQPSPGHRQMAIWPRRAPDAQAAAKAESMTVVRKGLVAGKPWIAVNDVSRPTMTFYSPKGKNTGAAVVVFPGGGYHILAIDLEGSEICDWFASRGITAVLLKYRVPYSGPYWDAKLRRHVQPKAPSALEDAQRTVGLVRSNSAKWHVDPNKIGVIGFSAGGHLVAQLSTHFDRRVYPLIDSADRLSCRPDFAIALYPGHLWSWTETDNPNFDLNPDIAKHINRRTPPTFLLQAQDDKVDNVNDSLVYYLALRKASVPVEMHLYPQGGHAFGLRRTRFAITEWPQLVERWLRTIGMVR
jgi:acetyl esterase/lipase